MSVARIENNTIAWIHLPPTETFPSGVSLGPGLNSVPEKYLEELKERSVRTEGKGGKTIHPGLLQLEELQQPVRFMTLEGAKVGPRITIFSDDQAGRPDGPPPPLDLRGYTLEQALAAVRLVSDPTVLRRWATDTRRQVKEAISAKLVPGG